MLTACGTGNGGSNGQVTVSPSTSASASSNVGSELGGPLGYFRAGGIAGFMDELMVSTDGVAVLQRHGKEVLRCKVKSAPLAQLAQLQAVAVKSIPSASSRPVKSPPHADMMTVGVIVNGVRVPSSEFASSTIQWTELFKTMSSLFEDAVALSPGATPSPNTTASLCDPI